MNMRIAAALSLGAFSGFGCGDASPPTGPGIAERLRIAADSPSTFSLGPAEAGKRAQDRVVPVPRDNLAAPATDAPWRWIAIGQSGWMYPTEGPKARDGRIAATRVPGSPGAGVLTRTADPGSSSQLTRYRTQSIAPLRPPASAVGVRMNRTIRADGYSIKTRSSHSLSPAPGPASCPTGEERSVRRTVPTCGNRSRQPKRRTVGRNLRSHNPPDFGSRLRDHIIGVWKIRSLTLMLSRTTGAGTCRPTACSAQLHTAP